MTKQISYITCMLISLIASSTLGTHNKPHTPKPIRQLTKQTTETNANKKSEITVQAKRLTYDDTYKLFGDRDKKIFYAKNPLAPIQISITNKSGTTWLLNDANINLNLEQIKNIKSRLHRPSTASMVGIFIAGAIPLALLEVGCHYYDCTRCGRHCLFCIPISIRHRSWSIDVRSIAGPFHRNANNARQKNRRSQKCRP